MGNRAARFGIVDLRRALQAAKDFAEETGEPWRVAIAPDGTIIVEPQPEPVETTIRPPRTDHPDLELVSDQDVAL